MNETNLPAEAFDLSERWRGELDDTEYVIYSDGYYTWAIEAGDYDAPTRETDYSRWCAETGSIDDRELAARIAAAADLSGVYVYGSGCWVNAVGR